MFITNLRYWSDISNLASSTLTSAVLNTYFTVFQFMWEKKKVIELNASENKRFYHLWLDWNWHLKVHLGLRVHNSVYFGCQSTLLFLSPSSHVAFIQIELWRIWLCSIHHTVLRVMVQRMEANHSVFDQDSCAILYAWPCSLLTHNLSREPFFFFFICIHTVTWS